MLAVLLKISDFVEVASPLLQVPSFTPPGHLGLFSYYSTLYHVLFLYITSIPKALTTQ